MTEYTDQQKQVIAHDHTKNGVVRAGPGTGKSLTVVALAQRLRADHPHVNIRFVTFTRAATSELMKKVRSEGQGLKPSTIHSFATSILMQNQDALPTQLPLRIPSEYETEKIIYPYIRGQIGAKNVRRIRKLTNAKASMWESLDPDFTLDDITPEEKARFVASFQKASRLFGFTLLSQLPDLLRRLISGQAEVRGLNFQFMIIDEYQDLNKCEIELLRLLNGKGITVLAVGDEDQSIYSFRMAHPAGIREFEAGFPEAVCYDLSICHRCPANLLNWAQHVIQGDLSRSQRPLPESKNKEDAEIKLLHFRNEEAEAEGVAELIGKLIKKEIQPHEILVLTRSDHQEAFTKGIKELLTKQSIPVFDSGETKALLEEKNARFLFAYMRLLANERDSLAWFTVMKESGGIGPSTLAPIFARAEAENISFGESVLVGETEELASKQAFIGIREKLDVMKEAYRIANEQGAVSWGQWITDTLIPLTSIEIVPKLIELMLAVDTRLEIENPSLSYFTSQLAPIAKDISNEQESGVRFMSMQSSKGLTARATIVIGVDNDLIPSPRNANQDEERRLLYVAMTRSQEFLFMTWANRRRGPQARSGTVNTLRRTHTAFLEAGPISSENGATYVESFS